MPRITTPDDLGQLNRVLNKIDKLEKKILNLQDELLETKKQVAISDATHAPNPTTNDLVFTWTGATGTLSWTQGSVQDKNAGSRIVVPGVQHTVPIPAGSISGLTANTYYWLSFCVSQRQMIVTQNAHDGIKDNDDFLICRVFTGTAGQSGVAGGGGSQASRDLSGADYKLF